jgi:HAD superfamily hydrolase (TIGR01509 family)
MTSNSQIKYILFDAANTLIYKPLLWSKMLEVLDQHQIKVEEQKLLYNHKLLSESILFPDRTSENFYYNFNTELLLSLGIIPTPQLLSDIFRNCTYMPWAKFEDTAWLKEATLPMGVLSNFNTSLSTLLLELFGNIFTHIIVSEEVKSRKPDVAFYQHAISTIGLAPEEILYVGDSLKLDIIPAQSLGLNTLLIDRADYFPSSPYAIKHLNDITNKMNLA